MAIIINTEQAMGAQGQLKAWAYNVLDVTGTREVFDTLAPRLNAQTARTYAFERACQAPSMAMMRRGVLVDEVKRGKRVLEIDVDLQRLGKEINQLPLVTDVWDVVEKDTGSCRKSTRKDGKHKWPRKEKDGPEIPDIGKQCVDCGKPRLKLKPFNPNSPDQGTHLFHELHEVPRQRKKDKEFGLDEAVLERIGRKWPKFLGITEIILECRGLKKQRGFLNSRLSPDGRMMSSFNVGAAWTGRYSSSKNPYRWGTNLQNISERNRDIFIADPGYEMFYIDLQQAESNVVAHLAQDEGYIEAHKSGDVHTYVARMVFPDLPWTGDLKEDKKIAKQNPGWDQAPGHDFRYQCKRIQHGANYGLSPFGIAMLAHIPVRHAKQMYLKYFDEFPYIKTWQQQKAKHVANGEPLINPLGRRCRLFGRPWDKHTVKQAFAFEPQSTVADIINIALWRVWKALDPHPVQLFAQVHDALLGQWKRECREEAASRLVELMTIPVSINGRVMTIGVDIECGRNWGHASESNPHGLRELDFDV